MDSAVEGRDDDEPRLPSPHETTSLLHEAVVTEKAVVVEDASTADSPANLSSSALNIADPPFAPFLHPDYLQPAHTPHPLEESVIAILAKGCLFYAAGFLLGLPLSLVGMVLCILLLPLRILAYLITRLTFHGLCSRLLFRDHCDPWWPLYGTQPICPAQSRTPSAKNSVTIRDAGREACGATGPRAPALCVLTVQGSIHPPQLAQTLADRVLRLSTRHGYARFPKFHERLGGDCCGGLSRQWVVVEDLEMARHVRLLQARLTSLADLENELNRLFAAPLDSSAPLWRLDVVPEFGDSHCTLLIIRAGPAITDTLCLPRLLSLLSDNPLGFDMEPRLRTSLLPPYNILISISYVLWSWCQVLTAGPLSLLTSAWRRPDPQWALSSSRPTPKQNPSTTIILDKKSKRYRVSMSSASRHSSASLVSPLNNVLRSTSNTPSLPQQLPSLLRKSPGLPRRVTWARVPGVEQLMRAERVLRASTLELLLAFVSGALRRHFRASGLRFPRNLQASLPVSCREMGPGVGKAGACDFVLVPVVLPVGVEGVIPRVWEVQRALTTAVDGAYPLAVRAAARLGDLVLPSAWNRGLMLRTHSGSGVVFSFLRSSEPGDLALGHRRIHSLLLYQPLPPNFHAAFTFVQSGHEMVVSLTVDSTAFPDPDVLLAGFQVQLTSFPSGKYTYQ